MTSPDWELPWGGPGADFLLPSPPNTLKSLVLAQPRALPLKISWSTGVTEAVTEPSRQQSWKSLKAKEVQKWRRSTQQKLSVKDGTELRTRWRKKSMKGEKELES